MDTVTEKVKEQSARYLQAWKALGVILRDGGSLSGSEKNCCFLNTQSHRFADVSSVVGFDHASDSRAIAVVDWDHDGDLDLWCSNRTAPRVRYLQNNSVSGNRFLAIQLEGVTCNRDAIGARVELELSDEGKLLTSRQTLRAGEGYLAQSSKWIHFGLGRAQIVKMAVHWPGGDTQVFSNLKVNSRYRLVQDRQPEEWTGDRNVALNDVKLPQPNPESHVRIIPARRLPLPTIQLVDGKGDPFTEVHNDESYTLLMIWATWCSPCVEEMKEFANHQAHLRKQRIRWLPVNVDSFESEDAAARTQLVKDALLRLDPSLPTILATQSAVECLDVVQRVLVTKQDALPVPCSFLLDRSGRLMAVYKGSITVEQVASDVEELERTTADPRDLAVPLAGRWAMDTFPPDWMAMPVELTNVNRSQEALDYLVQHVPTNDFEPPMTASQVTQTYLQIARQLVQKRNSVSARLALERALMVDAKNVSARMALAEIHAQLGQIPQAIRWYQEVLKIVPDQPLTLNNLAWLLAATPDELVRNSHEAVALADRLCQQTNYGDPASLDTLSVALASNGEFERAITMVEKAIRLAKQLGRVTAKMEARLKLFQDGKPYLERR